MNWNGYSPQRAYKMMTDFNVWQLVSFGIPLVLMFYSYSAKNISNVMILPSVIVMIIFVASCFLPSPHNFGKKIIISVMCSLQYSIRRTYERILMNI